MNSTLAPCDYILQSNLESALYLAIQACKERDAKISPDFQSTFRASLEANLATLQQGHALEIR